MINLINSASMCMKYYRMRWLGYHRPILNFTLKVTLASALLFLFQIRANALADKFNPSQSNQTIQQTIRGKVTNENNKVLSGISVIVKGTTIATSTDELGAYTIRVPATNSILVFKAIGFVTQEVPIQGKTEISLVLLAESSDLEEVVVLGFGQTQKRIAQTGSIASIGTKELRQSPVANITNALAGRLPGLVAIQQRGEPGNDMSNLYIRGISTMNGSEPLISIDGVQRDFRSIGQLDPNEVASVTILKDASATALYGVKGANGVIIVTTRRGTVGKPVINFTTEQAIQNMTEVPRFLGSYQNAILANEAYYNDNPTGTLPPYTEEAKEAFRTGSDPIRYPDVDWMGELFKTGRQTKSNFNISGGSPQVKYFVNVGYLDQGGIYRAEKNKDYDPNANFNRYNFRSNVDIEFNKNFDIGLKLFGAIENKKHTRLGVAAIFAGGMVMAPDHPIRYPTGFYAKESAFNNPVWYLNDWGYVEEYNSSLSGMLSSSLKLNFITQGLSLKGNFSFDGFFKNGMERQRLTPYAIYDGIGDYYDLGSYAYEFEDIPLSAPISSFTQNRDVWTDLSLNYSRVFGSHEVTGLLLANRTQRVLSNQVPYVSQGLVGRAVYNYKYKYFAELNFGYNGTDNFARGHRYGLFPAFSAGWDLSQESFLKNNKVIDLLKIRGSYGLVGNDQLGGRRWLFNSEYAYGAGYRFGDGLTDVIGVIEGAMGNPLVSWEKAKKTNIGFEASIYNRLFNITLDLFHEHRYNILLTPSSTPGILGISGSRLPPDNIGKVENKGIEIELGHKHQVKALNYFININGSFARNKILYQDEVVRKYPWMERTGHPIGQYFALRSIGFFRDAEDIENSPTQFGTLIPGDLKYQDLNSDGVINNEDVSAVGYSRIPELFFGLSGGINWKGIDFSLLFQGAARSSRTTEYIPYFEFADGGRKTAYHHWERWTPETAETATYPALHFGTNPNNHRSSSFHMENNSYLRLKNVEIGYTINKPAFTRGLGINAIRFYANGMNIFTSANVKLIDPEYNGVGGYDHPPMRLFNFGITVKL